MLEIFDCLQNTPEWIAARMGWPTASRFDAVLAKGRGKDENGKPNDSKTRTDYLLTLADDRIYGDPPPPYTNADLERGHQMEADARTNYALLHDVEPRQVGFVLNRDVGAGCSPDSLIGQDGLLEIKTTLPRLLTAVWLADRFPPEHKAQCQGALWITGRQWLDLMVYWPLRKPFIVRVQRDEEYIAALAAAVAAFNMELEQTVDRYRALLGRPQMSLTEKLQGTLAVRHAGIVCNDPHFQVFLRQHHPLTWEQTPGSAADKAAEVLRVIIAVESRKDLRSDPVALEQFNELLARYEMWKRE